MGYLFMLSFFKKKLGCFEVEDSHLGGFWLLVENVGNRGDSGFYANLPIPNHCDQNPRSGPAFPSGDSPPVYCETQNSNVCKNVEAPPSYDDGMKQ